MHCKYFCTVTEAPSTPTVVESNTYDSVPLQAPTPSFDPLIPCTCPISVNDLGTHVASCHSESNAGFNQQYQVMLKLFSIQFHVLIF